MTDTITEYYRVANLAQNEIGNKAVIKKECVESPFVDYGGCLVRACVPHECTDGAVMSVHYFHCRCLVVLCRFLATDVSLFLYLLEC